MTRPTTVKICYIGGGSRQWATHLMGDLALCSDLSGELVLYDIDHDAARRNEEHGRQLFAQEDARTTFAVRACGDRDEALRGADFVVMSIEPGPVEMRFADLEITKKYGILHTVGDTTGPGGIFRAARAVPTYLEYAQAIMRVCPQAWVINYTNPMTLCTQALYTAEPGIKAYGCCHEIYGCQKHFRDLACEELGLDPHEVRRQEVKLDVCGVNHFTLATAATFRGMDVLPLVRRRMQEASFWADQTAESVSLVEQGHYTKSLRRVAYDFLRRFGVYGAAGDRHLVENVSWYLAGGEESLHRWGVVVTPYSDRIKTAHSKRDERYQPKPLQKSEEEGVEQICGLLGIRDWDSNVNLPNHGQMRQLPMGAVVETMATFRHGHLHPIVASDLPPAAAALQQDVCATQQATLQAIVDRDREALFAAMLTDPLCTIAIDDARAMFDEALEHIAVYTPSWG